jgi:hypothetical protein
MTWKKALPIFSVAVVLDLLRGFFQLFWFFAPALAGIVCTFVAGKFVGSLWGLTAVVCASAATAGGVLAVEVIAPIGFIMADAIGFIEFLVLGFWIVWKNNRLFKTAATAPLYFVGAFAVDEIPIVGTLPLFTVVLWRLYKVQIQVEGEALANWKKAYVEEQKQARQKQIAQYMQLRAAQQAQIEEKEVGNDEHFYSEEAANDAQYTQNLQNQA